MAPRSYNLGRRARTSGATRRRILDAALESYRDAGIDGTTLTAVARRADVARGTIVNHFGSADGLLGEALDYLVEQLELPDDRLLDGIVELDARIRTFVDAMVAFQERSAPWWTTFQGEMGRPSLQERETQYWAAFERLLSTALGPDLAGDPRARAAIVSLSHPATAGTFAWAYERAGLQRDEARRALGELAVKALDGIAPKDEGGSS